jgi:phosphatidylethanolamine-binding protein (PEBP) family uncharacterized protein
MPLKIESPSFAAGNEIPIRFTGEGEDVSPPFSWSGVPSETKSLVLIVDDPDAPDPAAPKMVWVHWALYNLLRDEPSGRRESASRWDRRRIE